MHTLLLIEVIGQGLYTFNAYEELRLQMSTGDFHTHRTEFVSADPDVEYTDFDTDSGEFFVVNEVA